MKIIALLPVKNEAWVLPTYISSVLKIADEIIALDDGSTDESATILKNSGAFVLQHDLGSEKVINMSHRRTFLLEKGRERKGTHFIWLDADETFSINFLDKAKIIFGNLQPGQKLCMRWVHAWKDTENYLNDDSSPFGKIWKDFIVYDDGKMKFEERFLSEARTPGDSSNIITLPEKEGVVLHWQFSRWSMTQYKQALYRCIELLEGSRSARRINNTYRTTLDNKDFKIKTIPLEWVHGLTMPDIDTSGSNYYREQMLTLFQKYGIEQFEPLQIWHIEELKKIFIEKLGREPKSKVFPSWLILLNNIKNEIIKK